MYLNVQESPHGVMGGGGDDFAVIHSCLVSGEPNAASIEAFRRHLKHDAMDAVRMLLLVRHVCSRGQSSHLSCCLFPHTLRRIKGTTVQIYERETSSSTNLERSTDNSSSHAISSRRRCSSSNMLASSKCTRLHTHAPIGRNRYVPATPHCLDALLPSAWAVLTCVGIFAGRAWRWLLAAV